MQEDDNAEVKQAGVSSFSLTRRLFWCIGFSLQTLPEAREMLM
jgi:hypothetical protein